MYWRPWCRPRRCRLAAPSSWSAVLETGDLQRWLASEASGWGRPSTGRRAICSPPAGREPLRPGGPFGEAGGHAGGRTTISADDVKTLVGYRRSARCTSCRSRRPRRTWQGVTACSRARELRRGRPSAALEAGVAVPEAGRGEEAAGRGAPALRGDFAAADHVLCGRVPELVDGHSLAELVDKHGEILKADVALKTSGGTRCRSWNRWSAGWRRQSDRRRSCRVLHGLRTSLQGGPHRQGGHIFTSPDYTCPSCGSPRTRRRSTTTRSRRRSERDLVFKKGQVKSE